MSEPIRIPWREDWTFELTDTEVVATVMERDASGGCAGEVSAHIPIAAWDAAVATVTKTRKVAKSIDGLRLARQADGFVVLSLRGYTTGFNDVEWRQFTAALAAA